jgi:polysaccharide pyruvyl transferase WcaK-like protein
VNKIAIFDPTIATDNLGDFIIVDSVRQHLYSLFQDDFFYSIPTHECISKISRRLVSESSYSFVAGTNMLSSHFWWYRQWKIGIADILQMSNCILFGIGWHKYQSRPDFVSQAIYKKILNRRIAHSVRDKYTEAQLNSVGIDNVINTGCPTMWGLTPEHVRKIPRSSSNAAVVTVTEYLRNEAIDRVWSKAVLAHYDEIFFWPQTFSDLSYARELFDARLQIISPSLGAYDEFLASREVDYVGTRLHGGVRALQHRRRAMILQVDNRAREIARDTGLPSLPRDDVSGLLAWMRGSSSVEIDLPWQDIEQWKSQFACRDLNVR